MNTAEQGNNQVNEGGLKEEPKCRLRFKGIENFLRRVAFNLGNTPSQTEVKIISCIPIDVTDLQYKILTLEKELEDCQHRLLQEKDCAVVGTALVPQTRFPLPASPEPLATLSPPSVLSQNSLLNSQYLDSLHSLLPAVYSHDSHYAQSLTSSRAVLTESSMLIPLDKRVECDLTYSSLKEKTIEDMNQPQNYVEQERFRNILKKMKKNKKKREFNTHLVYYANTSQSPFQNYKFSMSSTSKPQTKETISRSFFEEVIRKQYKPERLADRTDMSQFSSPVCRDVPPPCHSTCLLDSDLCSCCHGKFHNLDKNSNESHEIFRLPLTDTKLNTNVYYDSSLYDVVPVKEMSTKIKKAEDIVKKKEVKPYYDDEFDMNINKRSKCNRYQPYFVNYHLTSVRNTNKSACKRKIPIKYTNRRSKSKMEVINPHSNVDCSSIYMKTLHKTNRKKIPEPVTRKQTDMKNAECLTTSVNNTECQTSSTKSVQLEPQPPVEDKTEETLNQIKTILQCVLTEVKTSGQMKPVLVEKCLKDAVVQKGVSQNNVETCSSMINSYTYSPYSTNQQFEASCSRQNNQACYPPWTGSSGGVCPPGRCLQNYPLFIQTTGRQCTYCFRNAGANGTGATHGLRAHRPPGPTSHGGSHITTSPRPTPLVSSGTNTEGDNAPARANETEKLIKEIYKSLTINMDYPPKGSSTSGYDDMRSSCNSKKVFDFNYVPCKPKSKDTGSDMSNNGTQETATTTSKSPVAMDTMVGSDGTSESASVRSERRQVMRNDQIQSYIVKKETRMTAESERGHVTSRQVPGSRLPPRPGAHLSDDSRSDTDSDPESDSTIVPNIKPGKPIMRKKERSGLFSKMVKLFKTKTKKAERLSESESEIEEEASESDSDDYQTVCSQQSKKKHVHYEKERPRQYKKVHSKISNPRKISQPERQFESYRRPPNMEQEYRRHWTEDIGFHEGYTPRYSTDHPTSRNYTQRTFPQPIPPQYYQAYNAKTYIDPRPPQFIPSIQEKQTMNTAFEASKPGPSKGPVDPGSKRPNGHADSNDKPRGLSVSIGPKIPLPRYDPALVRQPWGSRWLKKPKCIGSGEQWKKFILES